MFLRCLLLAAAALIAARADAQLFAPPTAPNQIVVDATNVLSQSVAMQNGSLSAGHYLSLDGISFQAES